MKSIAERKREQAEKEERKRMKRTKGASGVYRKVSIPAYNLGWAYTHGDTAFLKQKAQKLIAVCKDVAPHQFYRFIKEIILEEDRVIKEEQAKRDAMWQKAHPTRQPATVTPIVPTTTSPSVPAVAAPSVAGVAAGPTAAPAIEHITPIESTNEETTENNWIEWDPALTSNYENFVLTSRPVRRPRRTDSNRVRGRR